MLQLRSALMLACAVAHDHGAGSNTDLGANLLEIQVHALGIGRGRKHRINPACRSGPSKQVGIVMKSVAGHQRMRTDRDSFIRIFPFLPDRALMLELAFDLHQRPLRGPMVQINTEQSNNIVQCRIWVGHN